MTEMYMLIDDNMNTYELVIKENDDVVLKIQSQNKSEFIFKTLQTFLTLTSSLNRKEENEHERTNLD
jgi:hypothetical protein